MTTDAKKLREAARALLDVAPAGATDAGRLRLALAAVLGGSALSGDEGLAAFSAVATEFAGERVEVHVLAEGVTLVYGPDGRVERFELAREGGPALH